MSQGCEDGKNIEKQQRFLREASLKEDTETDFRRWLDASRGVASDEVVEMR